MSERVVSSDRWRCGRSSNKAHGINRNVGWFFIGGCFSRCRREELSRPYRPTSLSVDFSVLFAVPAILGDSFCNVRKKHGLAFSASERYLTTLTRVSLFSRARIFSWEDTRLTDTRLVLKKLSRVSIIGELLDIGGFLHGETDPE